MLSATLTAERRRKMIEKAGATEPCPAVSGYPLVTKVVGEKAPHHLVADPALLETTVHLEHIDAGNPDFIEDIARAA